MTTKPHKESRTKGRKYVGIMRGVVAANVGAAMRHRFAGSSNQPMALAKAARISLSSVQRVLDESVGASVDNLERIADALDLSVYQLLLPNLDAQNPQIVAGATSEEKRLYAMLRSSALAPPRAKPAQRSNSTS